MSIDILRVRHNNVALPMVVCMVTMTEEDIITKKVHCLVIGGSIPPHEQTESVT